MEHTKSSIRQRIINGDLKAGITTALEYAEYCGLVEVVNALSVLGYQFDDLKLKWNTGQITYEESSRKQAQINYKVNEWINHLPDRPVPKKGKRSRPLTESTFKSRIFYALCITKLLIFYYLYYHWRTGAFTIAEFQGTATLLVPAFAAYISVILGDYLRQHQSSIKVPKFISGPLVTFAYWLFPIYFIVLYLLIRAKAESNITFSQMNFWLAMVESVLGGYIGQLVHSLFKKD